MFANAWRSHYSVNLEWPVSQVSMNAAGQTNSQPSFPTESFRLGRESAIWPSFDRRTFGEGVPPQHERAGSSRMREVLSN
jgi:hypothetical protein